MWTFIILNLVWPSVLGRCCFPERFTAQMENKEMHTLSKFFIDFTKNEFLIEPNKGNADGIRWIVGNLQDDMSYVFYTNRTCMFLGVHPMMRFISAPTNTITSSIMVYYKLRRCVSNQATLISSVESSPVFGGDVREYKEPEYTIKVVLKNNGTKCLPVVRMANEVSGHPTHGFSQFRGDHSPELLIVPDTSNCFSSDDSIIG